LSGCSLKQVVDVLSSCDLALGVSETLPTASALALLLHCASGGRDDVAPQVQQGALREGADGNEQGEQGAAHSKDGDHVFLRTPAR
jgi:hypothetical protein